MDATYKDGHMIQISLERPRPVVFLPWEKSWVQETPITKDERMSALDTTFSKTEFFHHMTQ